MKQYKSEKGTFCLIGIMIGFLLILAVFMVWHSSVSSSDMVIIFLAYGAAAVAYFFSILYPLINTKYVLQDKSLMIRSGFYKKYISYNSIIEITQKSSMEREPALSGKRIYIKYKDGAKMKMVGISPKNKDVFLKAIDEITGKSII